VVKVKVKVDEIKTSILCCFNDIKSKCEKVTKVVVGGMVEKEW